MRPEARAAQCEDEARNDHFEVLICAGRRAGHERFFHPLNCGTDKPGTSVFAACAALMGVGAGGRQFLNARLCKKRTAKDWKECRRSAIGARAKSASPPAALQTCPEKIGVERNAIGKSGEFIDG